MNFLLLSIILMAPDVSLFDDKPLFEEPVAYQRTPDTGVIIFYEKQMGFYKDSNLSRREAIMAMEVSLGKNIPIITTSIGPLQLQTGLISGFWATLAYDPERGAFPLITQDFLIAFPIEFKLGKISGAFKFQHISGHQGDGLNAVIRGGLSDDQQDELDDVEEAVVNYTGEDISLQLMEPFSYSRDFFSFHIAYSDNLGALNTRIYTQIGYIHKMIPRKLKRWFGGVGVEVIYPYDSIAPYYAQDITYNQDTDTFDYSSQLGVYLTNRCRVASTLVVGSDRRGQLIGRDIKQFGVGFFFE